MSLTDRVEHWFVSVPTARYRSWSIALMLFASVVVMVDSIQLFVQIGAGEVVRVPRVKGLGLTPWTAGVAIAGWSTGTLAFLHRWTRVRLGWLAPLGAAATIALDAQTFADMTYLIVIASAMHWWSAWLEDRGGSSHLHGVPLRVIQTQISIVFLWTAFAKLNPRFLSGALLSVSFGGPLRPPEFVLDPDVLTTMAVITILVEVTFAIALWIDTLRPWALAGVAGFHGFILLFFQPTLPLTAFASIMASGYLLFAAEPWRNAAAGTART
jgi:hypothetical protein